MASLVGIEIEGYRILEQIGQGGMAKVYKAYQPGMDRVVALKILPDLYAQDQSATARFQQEARIIASLEHPHILPVYDFGEDDETAFLVMRYLQAGNLKNLLTAAPNGRLDLPDAALLTSQIASALDYAHQKGIIHRDVKPANVLIDPHGQAFLTDFGIAKVLEATQELTKTGSTLGTPAYMSPEQASGGDVDHRSDIYSLGIILYQMLTGTPPFEADTPYATIVAHLQEPLPLPSSLNPEIPEAVEQVLLKALARDPEDRFSSAGALAHALDQALKEEGIEKAQEKVSPAFLDLSGSLAGDRSSEELTIDDRELLKRATWERRRKKLLPWGVGLLLIVILFAAGIIVTQNSKKQTERLILNNQATQEAAPSATYDPTMISEMMQESTQTAQAYLYATATQAFFHRHQTQTVIALTPSSTPGPTSTHTPPPTAILLPTVEFESVNEISRFIVPGSEGGYGIKAHPKENIFAIPITSGNEPGVHIYEFEDKIRKINVLGLDKKITSIGFSDEGNYLAGASRSTLYIWDVQNFEIKHEFDILEYEVISSGQDHTVITPGGDRPIQFSPDGKFIAVSGAIVDGTNIKGKIEVYDVSEEQKTSEIEMTYGGIWSISWSPDSEIIAYGEGIESYATSFIHLWNPFSKEVLLTLESSHLVLDIEWLNDGHTLISGGDDEQVTYWNYNSGEIVKSKQFSSYVGNIKLSRDYEHLLISLGNEMFFFCNAVYLYDCHAYGEIPEQYQSFHVLEWSADEKMLLKPLRVDKFAIWQTPSDYH